MEDNKLRLNVCTCLNNYESLEIKLPKACGLINSEFITGNSKRDARAHVTVTYPGTGKLNIDGKGLEFFKNIRAKEQVSYTYNRLEVRLVIFRINANCIYIELSLYQVGN